MNNWGKDKKGNLYDKCGRCGSTTKPHSSRGFCRTCYSKWLADHNPEYKEKLKCRKREQKKRREKRRILEIKEEKSSAREVELGKLNLKYTQAKNTSIEIRTKADLVTEREKELFPDVVDYIEKLEKKLKFFPAINYNCPNCKINFLFEEPKKKSGPMSSKTCQRCPKCGYDPFNSMNCAICNKVLQRWIEGNDGWCKDCDNKLRQKHGDELEKFCCKCESELPKSDFSWQTNKLGYLDKDCHSPVCVCDKCKMQFDETEDLRLNNESQVWLEIEDDRVCGELPHLSLLFIAPVRGISYLRKSIYLYKTNVILNLKLLAGLPIEAEDLNYNPNGIKFAGENKEKIKERFNEKIILLHSSDNIDFLKKFVKRRGFVSKLLSSKNDFDWVCSDRLSKAEWNKNYHNLRKIIESSEYFNIELFPEYTDDDESKYLRIHGKDFVHDKEFTSEIEKLIRDSENEVRFEMGIPAIGEGWVSETSLFHQVKELCEKSGVKAIHHARPEWLGKQHLDIFVPELNFAIEYQGKQHNTPVGFFGGEEAHLKTLERDKRKKELCDQNNIELIYVNEGDDISRLLVDLDDRISTQ